MEIIPTLFALDNSSFNKKIEKLKFSKSIHFDFMDKSMTKQESIPLEYLNKIPKNIKKEVHLMTLNPEKYTEIINKINPSKILIHYECENLNQIIQKFTNSKIKIFIVLNPKTKLIGKLPDNINGIMCMTVDPGKEGQEIIEETLEKTKKLRKKYPTLPIQIDGGINENTIGKIKNYPIDILSIGSAISNSENPKESKKKLEKLLK